MREVIENKFRFEISEKGLYVIFGEIHGCHDVWLQRVSDICSGLCIRRKTFNVRNCDGDERDQVRMQVVWFQLGLCFCGCDEGDSVTPYG